LTVFADSPYLYRPWSVLPGKPDYVDDAEAEMTSELGDAELALAKIAADIVVAFVSRNEVDASDLPALTERVRNALHPDAGEGAAPMHHAAHAHMHHAHVHVEYAAGEHTHAKAAPRQAVPISKSVTHDFIVCLEDGKQFRSLRRHLRQEHNMTVDEYRAKWGLPAHYELVAPGYSDVRKALAKQHGLGRRRDDRFEETPRVAAE
jgi:predicted transcriptional regulator